MSDAVNAGEAAGGNEFRCPAPRATQGGSRQLGGRPAQALTPLMTVGEKDFGAGGVSARAWAAAAPAAEEPAQPQAEKAAGGFRPSRHAPPVAAMDLVLDDFFVDFCNREAPLLGDDLFGFLAQNLFGCQAAAGLQAGSATAASTPGGQPPAAWCPFTEATSATLASLVAASHPNLPWPIQTRTCSYPDSPLESPSFANFADVLPAEPGRAQWGAIEEKLVTPPQSPWSQSAQLLEHLHLTYGEKLINAMFPPLGTASELPVDGAGGLHGGGLPNGALLLPPGDLPFDPSFFASHNPASTGMPASRQPRQNDLQRSPSADALPTSAAALVHQPSAGTGSIPVVPVLLDLARRGLIAGQPSERPLPALESQPSESGDPVSSDTESERSSSESADGEFDPQSRKRKAPPTQPSAGRPERRPAPRTSGPTRLALHANKPSPRKPSKSNIPPGSDGSEFISPKVLNAASLLLYSLPSSALTPSQRSSVIAHILAKRERNTESARKSRIRRREHLDGLEGRVRELEEENRRLREKAKELERRM